ncbi:MAG: RHS repeat-associated core domain-containing protein [Candidatus Obscuribacterales bacterium]|nr:RHS repeat-associated core domain-containing protein [Candidatus Obscuribacterales bacterium]
MRGGGSEIYEAANPYSHDVYSQALLVAGSDYYQRDLPDGSTEIFSTYDGTENYFLTHIVDPQANVTTISYDDTFRVTSVIDSFGQASTFDYGSDTEGETAYYAITQITDPFGRTAVFQYDSTFTNLVSITDQIGMQSSFVYSPTIASFISTMVTPYGQTNFEIYTPSDIAVGLKTTFPDGTISQIESWIGIDMKTHFWDRWAMTLYPNDPANRDYSHCVTTHWVGEPTTEIMSAVPFWVQPPLDYTIWYMYNDCYWNGYAPAPDHFWLGDQTINKPIQILRTMPNSMPPSLESVQTWTYSYGTDPKSNSFGYVIQSQDPLATPRVFDYNLASNNIDLLSTKQDTTGELLNQWTFNSQHRPLTQTDGSGNVTSITYNDQGQPLTYTDANGSVTTLTYSAQAAILGGTVESGDTKTLSIVINNASLPGGTITKSYTVGSSDTLSSIATALASAINSDTNLQAAAITATWIALEPISQTPAVYINSFSTDATTYEVSTSGSGAETITLASSTCGYLMQVEGPLGALNVSSFTYDSVGRLYTTTTSEGYTLTRFYDNLDRPTQVTYPDGTSERNVWDKLDIVASYDRLGNAHQYAYNSLDQLAFEIDALGQKTQYSWCRCGAMSQLIDPNGNTTKWLYDLQGRLVKKTYQDSTTVNYSYDVLGRLATRIDALGQVTTYSYNLDNTIAEITYSNVVNTTPTVVYSYDEYFSRLTQVSNYTTDPGTPIADYLYSYNPYVASASNNAYIFIGGYPQTPDETDTINVTFFNSALSGGEFAMPTYSVLTADAGNPSQVATDFAAAINANSTLSAAGITASANRTLVTVSAGSAVTVSTSATGGTTALIGGGGMLASVTNSVIENSTVSYGYDSLARTVKRMIDGANNLITWDYDVISRVTSETNTLGTFDYAYVNDVSGESKGDPRLASISYPNGQLTKFAYYPNLLDERLQQISNLKSDGSTLSQFDYSYDSVGRITQWPQLQNNTSSFYNLTYDRIGQLTAAQVGNGGSSISRSYLSQLYYGYDPGANRTAVQTVVTVNARIGGSATVADVLTLTVKDSALPDGAVSVSYTVQSGDSLTVIAAAWAVAINTNSDLQSLGVTAIPSATILTLRSVSANITTYATTVSSGATETITFGVTENFVVNATIGGSKTTGDTVSLTAFDAALTGGFKTITYTVLSADTPTTIATGLTSAVNADSDLSSLGVTATSAGAVVTIRSTSDNATTYSQSTSSGATETITLSINPNPSKLVAIGGSKTTDDVLNLYFYDAGLEDEIDNISYTVLSGDTLTSIAAALTTAINAATNLQSIGLSASSSANLITIQSNSTNLTTYRQTVNNDATEQIILNVPANGTQTAVVGGSKTTGDVLTISIFDDGLSGGNVAIDYTVLSGDTLTSIASALAAAINSNSDLAAIGVSASSDSTVVYILSNSIHLTTYSQSVSSAATETITLGASFGISQSVCNNVNELVAILPGGQARFEGLTNKPVTSVTISSDTISVDYTQVNYPSYTVSDNSSTALTLGTLVDGGNTITVGPSIITVTTISPALTGGQISVNYTVQPSDDFAGIASGIASAVNAETSLAAIGVSATSSASVVDISTNPPTYSVSTSSGATETLTLGTNVLGKVTIKIGGTVTTGDTLTVTTNNVALSSGTRSKTYTVQSGDTLTSIAEAIAELLNGDSELSGIGISATGQSVANLSWSQSFNGSATLSEGTNSITVSAVDAVPTTASSNLQLLIKGPSEQTLEYDLNGNMTSDGTNTYQWDAENRLIQINYPGTGNNSQFSFDGHGINVKIIELTGGSITSTRQFIWSANSREESRDSSGTLLGQYFSGGQSSGENHYFYSTDFLGSITELTDATDNIQAQYSYNPFGRPTKLQGTSTPDVQYASYYFHGPSGLNLTVNRAYCAALGRWINRDPIGESGGDNLYGYVENNPISSIDPLGLQTFDLHACKGRSNFSGPPQQFSGPPGQDPPQPPPNFPPPPPLNPPGDGGIGTGVGGGSGNWHYGLIGTYLSQPHSHLDNGLVGGLLGTGVGLYTFGGYIYSYIYLSPVLGVGGTLLGRTYDKVGGSWNSNNIIRFGWSWGNYMQKRYMLRFGFGPVPPKTIDPFLRELLNLIKHWHVM